jgi:hypothetical protein
MTRLLAGHKRDRGSIFAWGKHFSVHQVQIVSGVHPDFQPLYHHPNKLHRETRYKQKKNPVKKSSHGATHPQYTKDPYSQKSTIFNLPIYNDHTEALCHFPTLHSINISRCAYIYIRAGHTEKKNTKIFQLHYSNINIPTTYNT